jgi:acyl-CoA thioesterase-1
MFYFSTRSLATPTPPQLRVEQAERGAGVTDTPEKEEVTIVAFGDSLTAGLGLDLGEAYPAELERLLRSGGISARVINSGVSGETTAGGLRRVDFVMALEPDIVIVALGGNDMLRGIDPAASKENLSGIITQLQSGGVNVILAGMYAPSNLGESYIREYNAIYPSLAETYSLVLIPFLLEGVALVPELNQGDGIHPNSLGIKIVAEQNVLPAILRVLDIEGLRSQ